MVSHVNKYKLRYAQFDWFRNRSETLFTSEKVDKDTETKWRTEKVASLPFYGLYLNTLL